MRNVVNEAGGGLHFHLVQSKIPVASNEKLTLKDKVEPDEIIRSDFFGATEEECRAWAREHGNRYRMIDSSWFAMADPDSVRLNCLSLQIWVDADQPESYGHFGVIPRDGGDKWYTFRLLPDHAAEMMAQIEFYNGAPQDNDIPYFGFIKELTDENGVFDFEKATEIKLGNLPEYMNYSDPDMIPDSAKQFLPEYNDALPQGNTPP